MIGFEQMLASIREQGMRVAADEGCVAIGFARCPTCLQVRRWEDPPTCDCAEREAKVKAREARERILGRAYRSIPEAFGWARHRNQAYLDARLHGAARAFAEAWRPGKGNVLVTGPTGRGKTACTIALLHRFLDNARDNDLGVVALDYAKRIRFTSAQALCFARQSWEQEPELISDAKWASLLVVDEWGPETDSKGALFEVINSRYEDGKQTILTTGMDKIAFARRYGDALARRVIERGLVVSLWEGEK